MKVSVSLITYNHKKFITEAIESILNQVTDFDFEILIGEDDSKDGTREIVKSYGERYPDKIRLILNDRENVIYIDGHPTGRWNFVNNLKHAKGEYIALLDGDDYWTSKHKLQRQADFLDDHPQCALCFHRIDIVDENKNIQPEPFIPNKNATIMKLEDLLDGNFIYTCSVMYRAGLFGEFPEWFFHIPIGDWPLHVLNAQHGDIGFIDEKMGAYRIHRGSIWSSTSRENILKRSIQTTEIIRSHLDSKYERQLDKTIEIINYKIKIEQMKNIVKSMKNTYSWKITQPLRWFGRMILEKGGGEKE